MALAVLAVTFSALPGIADAATYTIAPFADARVEESAATTNFGSSSTLRTDGGSDPDVETYIGFNVSGLSGSVASATLRLYAPGDGTADGPAVYGSPTTWGETTITWATRPGATTSALADKAAIAADTWTEFDVTAVVKGDGTYSFRLAPTSNDGINFASRQNATTTIRPVLVVVTNAGSDTTAPTVGLTAPANGSTVSGQVAVSATASDNVGVTRVVFNVDGAVVATDSAAPWGFTLDTASLTDGSHTISAQAFDAAGNASSASSVAITTANAAPPPPTTSSCSWYVAPTGSTANTGRSATSPLPLTSVASKTIPGDVVCVTAGTYTLSSSLYISKSGAPGKYIVYRNYGGTATVKWAGGATTMIGITSGTSYIEINGLTIDAANTANQDVNCNTAHHVRVIGNRLLNGGAAGFSSYRCDYMTVDRNLIHHAGYAAGWSSGISLNQSLWNDSYSGFHSFVTNNIISGTYDNSSYHSDGNGIIMDGGGDIPPVLVANNLMYENYYRCIHNFHVRNIWIVNNTCYKNALRYNPPGDVSGEITLYDAQNVHVINNIVYAWTTTYPYKVESGSSAIFQRNAAYGGKMSIVPSTVLNDPSQLRTIDPLFVSPLYVDPTASGQWATAVAPWNVGNSFQLQSASPLVNQGIDPRTATGATAELQAGIGAHLGQDLVGQTRPQSGAYDLGAYER